MIMPAYNAEKCIGRAIASVLGQSRGDWELLVIDDGSTDGTAAVARSFSDPRVRCLHQENGGVSAARNRGIREAQGDYICFLDADDVWRAGHLAELAELINAFPDCGLYCTGHDTRLRDGRLIHRTERCLRDVPSVRFICSDGYGALARYGYFLITGALCVPQGALDRVGLFAPGVRSGEDDDLWLRIFAYYPVAVSRVVTMEYDRRQSGLTAQRAERYENPFPGRVAELVKRMFAQEVRQPRELPRQTDLTPGVRQDRREAMEVAQGKLCMGFLTPITNRDHRFAAMQVTNGILGGDVTSKLFQNVREKQSLCYSIGSGYYAAKGIVLVSAGIDFDKEDHVRREILSQLEACQRGQITDEELSASKQSLLTALRSVQDSPSAMENYYSAISMAQTGRSWQTHMELLAKVTKEDVVACAKTLELHSTYFLEGGDFCAAL